jgi:rod shape-determining protein MreC
MFANLNRIWNGYKEYIVLVILLLISLSLISLSQKPAIKKVKTSAFGSFAVLTSIFSKVLEPFQSSFEVENLREENARLMLQVNQLREDGVQTDELRRMLAFKDSSDYPLIPAKIVSKYVSTTQGNFIINAGKNQNVGIGMPVIHDKGLVGVIESVGNEFSIVRTLKNHELKFAVKNQRSRFDGVIEWNGTDLIIKDVPKTYDMEVGDRIISSDFSTKFPPSIPVGAVIGGNRDRTGIFNNIIVKPFVDFIRIENVFVIGIVPSFQKNGVELNLARGN